MLPIVVSISFLKRLKATSTTSTMEEFAVTAAGHSFVGHINQPRIHNFPAETIGLAATMPTLCQTKKVQMIRKTTETLTSSSNVVQTLKPRGNAKNAGITVALK